MTTQDLERVSYGITRSGSGLLRIEASDPDHAGRTSTVHVGDAFTAHNGFGIGPVFTMEVIRPTASA